MIRAKPTTNQIIKYDMWNCKECGKFGTLDEFTNDKYQLTCNKCLKIKNKTQITIPIYFAIDEKDKHKVLDRGSMEQEFNEKVNQLVWSGEYKETFED